MKVNFKRTQKVTMGALVAMGLFNPMSIQVLDEYFKLFYTGVFLVSSVWVVLFVLWGALKPQKVNIPTKGKKTTKNAMQYENI